jgi:glycosyltransferase involved in cell wall biosynthesis
MNAERIIALLGRRDEPTDGVADYCGWLGGSLAGYGYQLETVRVNWLELGWRAALAELEEKSVEWRGQWVLLQYTVLAWSKRGFPRHAPRIVSRLKKNGVHCGIVFHDFHPFGGDRIIDRARHHYQLRILRRLYQRVSFASFTAPLQKVTWLSSRDPKAIFIPIGANCPELTGGSLSSKGPSTVAVFCVTTDHRMAQEVSDIGYALKRAESVLGTLRLVVFGRGSQEAASALHAEFSGTCVDVKTLGLLSPEDVSRTLACADVMLFVRGYISSRRGSAIAGIACGLPIVGFESEDTAWPLTEAGLVLAPENNREALSAALVNVLSDPALQQTLRERSRHAQKQYFSWTAIAQQFATGLRRAAPPSSEEPTSKIAVSARSS